MHATRKVKVKDLTPNLTCNLCRGYFIDATTIIECLHSFCRSCIVQHLEKSEYCPICDVQLHSTKPLTSIRSDQMLQEIVYKLVPGLFESEMKKRRQFYKENPISLPTNQHDAGHTNESYITSDDDISLSLEYYTTDEKFRESTRRYVKCQAAVSIAILKKLIQGKYDLNKSVQIDVMYGDRILPEDFLLMDIAYKYSWTQNGKPLQLSYRVKGLVMDSKKPSTETKIKKKLPTNNSMKKCTPKEINGMRKLALTNNNNNNNFATPPSSKLAYKSPSLISNESVKRKNIKINGITSTTTSDEMILLKDSSIITPASLPKLIPSGVNGGKGRKRKLTKGSPSLDVDKNLKSPVHKQPKYETNNNNPISTSTINDMSITNSSGAEVQLRISETGVISATSIISTVDGNEKKIILNVPQKSTTIRKVITSKNQQQFANDKSNARCGNSKMEIANGAHHPQNGQFSSGNGMDFSQQQQMKTQVKNKLKIGRKSLDEKLGKIPNGGTISNNKVPKNKHQNQQTEKVGPIRLSMCGNDSQSPKRDKKTMIHENGHEKLLKQKQHPQLMYASPKKSNVNGNTAKRFHSTSTLNGDLKFTTNSSPLNTKNQQHQQPLHEQMQAGGILNINGVEIIPTTLSPNKKPPKFFKSRANSGTMVSQVPGPSCELSSNSNGTFSQVHNGTQFNNGSTPSDSDVSFPTTTAGQSSTNTTNGPSVMDSSSSTFYSNGFTTKCSNSLSPTMSNNLSNTIETTATTSVMVPIPTNSQFTTYNNNGQVYRLPTGATTTANIWSGADLLRMGYGPSNIPLNLVPFIANNLNTAATMPFYGTHANIGNINFATAAAIQQQLQLQAQRNSNTASATNAQQQISFSIQNQLIAQQQQQQLQQNHNLYQQYHQALLHQQQQQQQQQAFELANRDNNAYAAAAAATSLDLSISPKKTSPKNNNNNKRNDFSNDATDLKKNGSQLQNNNNISPTKKMKSADGKPSPVRTYKKRSPSTTPKKSSSKDQKVNASPKPLITAQISKISENNHKDAAVTILQIPNVAMPQSESPIVSEKVDSNTPEKTSLMDNNTEPPSQVDELPSNNSELPTTNPEITDLPIAETSKEPEFETPLEKIISEDSCPEFFVRESGSSENNKKYQSTNETFSGNDSANIASNIRSEDSCSPILTIAENPIVNDDANTENETKVSNACETENVTPIEIATIEPIEPPPLSGGIEVTNISSPSKTMINIANEDQIATKICATSQNNNNTGEISNLTSSNENIDLGTSLSTDSPSSSSSTEIGGTETTIIPTSTLT